ncbi:hypothetical protein ABZ883_04735 [Streptomyces sp. NPDC046977]|uniref:hypothetical protein n=1 Tax=Streptomyces sp. NPDC046977 TaxID=3154703 RepID=UPI0033CEF23C
MPEPLSGDADEIARHLAATDITDPTGKTLVLGHQWATAVVKRIDNVIQERDDALAAIERARSLHYSESVEANTTAMQCAHDGEPTPCSTIRLLSDPSDWPPVGTVTAPQSNTFFGVKTGRISLPLYPAHGGYDRIDAVVVSRPLDPWVLSGTPALDPRPPEIPADHEVLAWVRVHRRATEIQPTDITPTGAGQ